MSNKACTADLGREEEIETRFLHSLSKLLDAVDQLHSLYVSGKPHSMSIEHKDTRVETAHT